MGEGSLIKLAFVDIEVTHLRMFGRAGWERLQRRAVEESDFDILREAMNAEEPEVVLYPIEGRVPLHCLAHAGHEAFDQRIDAAPDLAFPARHGCDIGLHRRIAVSLGDLGIA